MLKQFNIIFELALGRKNSGEQLRQQSVKIQRNYQSDRLPL